jgi:SAM-dependent methyltransferase
MNASSPKIQKKSSGPSFWSRLLAEIVGLARDYWKDAPRAAKNKSPAGAASGQNGSFSRLLAEASSEELTPEEAPEEASEEKTTGGHWRADRIQVMQKIWGEGYVTPGGDAFFDLLTKPLECTANKSVLDLSAGLGGGARFLATKYKAIVTGFEVDPVMAKRGTMMSIAAGKAKMAGVCAYDPEKFATAKKYDCVVARELFYRVIGKARFFRTISESMVPQGRIVFSDYLLDSGAHEKPDIAAWLAARRKASPFSFREMLEAWQGAGIEIQENKDETDRIMREIMRSLAAFTLFLSTHKPDSVTKIYVLKEIELWARQAAAMKAGLRLFRFSGQKK